MRTPSFARTVLAAGALALLAGCSASPAPPESASPPPASSPAPSTSSSTMGVGRIIYGSADSVGPLPGSPTAQYQYRFRQTDPGSDTFTFKDRELSFSFRPTPDVLRFMVENLTDRPVYIDWDHSVFYDPFGASGKVAHMGTTYRDRRSPQAPTQIPGLQRYGDYAIPMDNLLDPGADERQLFRALFPEDENAPQYSGRDFGVDLAFRVDNQPRTYAFRFRVVSVLPR